MKRKHYQAFSKRLLGYKAHKTILQLVHDLSCLVFTESGLQLLPLSNFWILFSDYLASFSCWKSRSNAV